MTAEQKHGSNEPPIVDPRQFLDKPFERLEVGRLASSPDIALLRWLPTLPNETGLVLQTPNWYVVKASEMGIPSWLMPHDSDILLHSHPTDEDEEQNPGSIPSTRDFLNCSPTAANFITSHQGLTQYWSVDPNNRRYLEAEVMSMRERFGRGRKDEYLQFLEQIGAKFTIHTWEELNNDNLNQLLAFLK